MTVYQQGNTVTSDTLISACQQAKIKYLELNLNKKIQELPLFLLLEMMNQMKVTINSVSRK